MGNENNRMIIITRCLSPPTKNRSEIIYSGKWLDGKEIPKSVNIGPEMPDNYFYTISEVKIKKGNGDGEDTLEIRSNHVLYDALLEGYTSIIDPTSRTVTTSQLSLNSSVKEGLIKLLQAKN